MRVGGVRGRRAQLAAFQILGFDDAAALAADDRERRLVVNHEDRPDRRAGILIAEFHQRIDVREAHIVVAGRNAGDRFGRGERGVDGHLHALGLEAALVDGDHERGDRTFDFAVERELDRSLRSGSARQRSDPRDREQGPGGAMPRFVEQTHIGNAFTPAAGNFHIEQ